MAGIPSFHNIFQKDTSFERNAADIFRFQYSHNPVYREWCDHLQKSNSFSEITNIPFLPISFFKTHKVYAENKQPDAVFTSSGTTGSVNSRHEVAHLSVYEESFFRGFELFYGDPKKFCFAGLLPGYLERQGSSLVYMVDKLIETSAHTSSGTYLYDHDKLSTLLKHNEREHIPTLLIGVTYALLDFAEKFPMSLQNTMIMETGGMKGKREEMTRKEVHAVLQQAFGVKHIHSEYGMTELLSQGYSAGEGIFKCPPWMKVLVRDETDPFAVSTKGRGAINIIDLANRYSCSFIATDDLGIVYEDGTFEILGRMDNSDIRGCSLLTV